MLTLVLLPGMDGTGDLFHPLIHEIEDFVNVQLISYPVDSIDGYPRLTDFVRDKLPKDSDFVLLGESFSGPIAINLASERNPKLRGLILCCTFISNPRPGLRFFKCFLPLFPFGLASTKFIVHRLLGKFSTVAICELIQSSIKKVPAETIKSRILEVMSVNVENELRKIDVPILYLKARLDLLVPSNVLAHIKRIKHDVRVALIDGPHFLLQVNPSAAATAIKHFASEVRSHKES
jgi:pimeloyl-[acyl-carrier protein] methyl ester esterase